MKGYWVCVYEKINNVEKLKEYAIKAKPAVEKFSGKFLIRGGKNRTNEGIDSPRTVVVEFSDYNTALKWSEYLNNRVNIIRATTMKIIFKIFIYSI